MQCDQIRPYIDSYAEGTLPGYKVAWVVQHLAGCEACHAAADAARRCPARSVQQAPVAATVEPARAETAFEPVQRPVPRWLQWATAILVMAAAGGAVWLILGQKWIMA
ncbi:MAG TPA: zf-HC2 domain-containing protein [Symbiobacteriaceae bacterium]|nr:zf-HC2 domain-containing protein [Symbiobacteriaceae bacterium]